MDEEEELDNTLIGQEEAPQLSMEDILMGAEVPASRFGQVPASTFGQAPASNPFSVQAFEDPSFTRATGDAPVLTQPDQNSLEFLGRGRYNQFKNQRATALTKALDDYVTKKPFGPLSFKEIDDAQEENYNKMYAIDFLRNNSYDDISGEGFPLDRRSELLAEEIERKADNLRKFSNTFAEPNSPQANFLARIETGEPLSPEEVKDAEALAARMKTTFDPETGYSREPFNVARNAELNPQMTGLRPVDPRTGEFLSPEIVALGPIAGKEFPSQVSLPVPKAPPPPIPPMGPEETRARLGGMTLNEYLNAPAGTPEQRTEQFVDPQGRLRRRLTPEASALQGFAPGVQPLAPEYTDFEQASTDLQDRLRDEQTRPGETQQERDTRIAQSRVTGGQTRVLSFDDARTRARGQLAARGIRNPSASQVNALARSIQAAEPERLAELATQRDKDDLSMAKGELTIEQGQAALADADSFNTSISNSTSDAGVVDYNKALNEYVRGGGSNRGYLEFLRKGQELEKEAIDAGKTPEIESVIIGDPETGFRALLQDGKIMQATPISGLDDPSNIRTRDANIELLTLAREDYLSGDPERMAKAEIQVLAANMKGEFGAQLTAKDLFAPDANDNSKTFDPDALTGKDKEAYNFAIENPNAPQSASILRLLGAN